MMLKAGQNFAHFTILRMLGEGGMGQVFLAEDQKLGRKVALKILTGDIFEDNLPLERFQREAKTAAQITNSYVMGIYDIGKAKNKESGDDLNYIVMEYVDGRALTDYAKEERLNLAKQIRLAEKIASGISAAHKLNIVHRDIKPDNIIVDDNHDPRILDFGLAKPLEPMQFEKGVDSTQSMSQELTRVGKIIGTVSYMSPEQVRGEKVDTRSDIFSFGILLYRLVTGDLPFTGPTQVETMAKILESIPDTISSKLDSIPPELERIVTKCLQKDPEERYQDARDLVVDLRNLRKQHDSGVTDTVSALTNSREKKGKSKTFIFSTPGWVIIVAIVIFAGFMLSDLRFDGDNPPNHSMELQAKDNSLAILGFENKTGDAELDWLQTGLPEILLTDLSQGTELQIISQQRILDCLPTEIKFSHTREESIKAARKIGTSRILSGTFFRLGDKIRIDARLEDINTGQIILAQKVVGEDPFILVDSLTEKIAKSLGLEKLKQGVDYATSTAAYKPYHLGMEHLWAGQNEEAIEKFHEAIAIDSTFALPYMRIGMANVFQGKQAEGAKYFRLAGNYKDRLPIRERAMLDAYTDTWLNKQFDQAFTKLSSILISHPDDAEIRTIYALFINAFKRDTAMAFAHLDTVLSLYPNYPFALETKVQLLYGNSLYDQAIELNEKLIHVIPDALDPQIRLVRLYNRQGRRDDAFDLAMQLHSKFPDKPEPLYRLISLSVFKREFSKAKGFVEEFKALDSEDPYRMITYYQFLANLALWEGQFRKNMVFQNKSLDFAIQSGDSAQVANRLSSISYDFRVQHKFDSVLFYAEKSDQWLQPFNRLNYPLTLAGVAFVKGDTSHLAKARTLMKDVMNDFRARVPKDFWTVADNLEKFFEAMASKDTSAVIASLTRLADDQNSQNQNIRELGFMLIKTGHYQEGKNRLSRFISGEFESTSGFLYPMSNYHIGVANMELGKADAAAKNFREMLRFWGNPDMEIEEITDARERLAKLTS